MRLLSLRLKNIGPFINEKLDFISHKNHTDSSPVVIITGENGTGKTIILDTIRALFYSKSNKIEREIVRVNSDFLGELNIEYNGEERKISSSILSKYGFILETNSLNHINFSGRFSPINREVPNSNWNWILDYWTSKLSNDSFEIKSLITPKVEEVYQHSLEGIQKNVEVSQLICFFDYLRGSQDPKESELGEYLFVILKKIVKISLIDGELKYVSRTNLQPIVSQLGQDLSLDKLSSGNLYLIKRMVSLLGKMYCLYIINQTSIDELCNTGGVLLIDEAENHLHPKWQKTFLKSIQELFPNLQIIVTTHSPFIVSSVDNAKVFVCKSKGDHAEIVDETNIYSNMPVEEILLSPLFGETHPFNQHITQLLEDRKKATEQKDIARKRDIEKELLELNPQYFNYFNIDNILGEMMEKQGQ